MTSSPLLSPLIFHVVVNNCNLVRSHRWNDINATISQWDEVCTFLKWVWIMCELQIASYELRVGPASCELRVDIARCELFLRVGFVRCVLVLRVASCFCELVL